VSSDNLIVEFNIRKALHCSHLGIEGLLPKKFRLLTAFVET